MTQLEVPRNEELGSDHCHIQLPLLLPAGPNLKDSSVWGKDLSSLSTLSGLFGSKCGWAQKDFKSSIKVVTQSFALCFQVKLDKKDPENRMSGWRCETWLCFFPEEEQEPSICQVSMAARTHRLHLSSHAKVIADKYVYSTAVTNATF